MLVNDGEWVRRVRNVGEWEGMLDYGWKSMGLVGNG